MIPVQIDAKDFFLGELLEKLTPEQPENIHLQHPFSREEIQGSKQVFSALEQLANPLSSLCGDSEYSQPGFSAKCWDANFNGRKIRGVTTVCTPGSGGGVESAIMLNAFPAASLWREQVMMDSHDRFPQSAWDLPFDANPASVPLVPESELDPKLPFSIAEDMIFHSPVLSRPALGSELITRIFAHTSVIYGDRKYGPKIQIGSNVFSFWEATVSGFKIQVANEIHFNEKREVDEMVMSMRPWPVVNLFREQCLARTEHFLDVSYFE